MADQQLTEMQRTLDAILEVLREMNARQRTPAEIAERQRQAMRDYNESAREAAEEEEYDRFRELQEDSARNRTTGY